jgi:hypothetical protein
MPYKKPPIGLMPRSIWIAGRINDILCAVNRRIESDMPIPTEWIEEYNLLIKENKA